ncbi:hypothetical protein BMETH_739_1 [methanotrophic bacterial endosymbiont of Bathymodiolus sp.]|nr:hypothetical protein BMETH_739_1 [methanotrophic bacterial endosymbiont of Bathymodiolus sp.]
MCVFKACPLLDTGRSNRRIANYATIVTTWKTDKRISQNQRLLNPCSLTLTKITSL